MRASGASSARQREAVADAQAPRGPTHEPVEERLGFFTVAADVPLHQIGRPQEITRSRYTGQSLLDSLQGYDRLERLAAAQLQPAERVQRAGLAVVVVGSARQLDGAPGVLAARLRAEHRLHIGQSDQCPGHPVVLVQRTGGLDRLVGRHARRRHPTGATLEVGEHAEGDDEVDFRVPRPEVLDRPLQQPSGQVEVLMHGQAFGEVHSLGGQVAPAEVQPGPAPRGLQARRGLAVDEALPRERGENRRRRLSAQPVAQASGMGNNLSRAPVVEPIGGVVPGVIEQVGRPDWIERLHPPGLRNAGLDARPDLASCTRQVQLRLEQVGAQQGFVGQLEPFRKHGRGPRVWPESRAALPARSSRGARRAGSRVSRAERSSSRLSSTRLRPAARRAAASKASASSSSTPTAA